MCRVGCGLWVVRGRRVHRVWIRPDGRESDLPWRAVEDGCVLWWEP